MTDVQAWVETELVTIDTAAREVGLTYWQTLRALNLGHLQAVNLPGGGRAVLRSSIPALKARVQSGEHRTYRRFGR